MGLFEDPLLICEVGLILSPQLVEQALGPAAGSVLGYTDGPVGGDIGPERGPNSGSVPGQHIGPLEPDFSEKGFGDCNVPPILVPSPGFRWQFLAGVWARVPAVAYSNTGTNPFEGD